MSRPLIPNPVKPANIRIGLADPPCFSRTIAGNAILTRARRTKKHAALQPWLRQFWASNHTWSRLWPPCLRLSKMRPQCQPALCPHPRPYSRREYRLRSPRRLAPAIHACQAKWRTSGTAGSIFLLCQLVECISGVSWQFHLISSTNSPYP